MSKWHEVKLDDMELDGDEINIQCPPDKDGNRYVVVKVKDVKCLLRNITDIKNSYKSIHKKTIKNKSLKDTIKLLWLLAVVSSNEWVNSNAAKEAFYATIVDLMDHNKEEVQNIVKELMNEQD